MSTSMIAENKVDQMNIVLSEQAGIQAQNAADELLYYLERMTGACFTIEKAASVQAMSRPAIALGEAALWLGLLQPQDLGEDGFVIRTIGDSLTVYGGKRGILYGVYELLERLGCRFFTPLCEKVPTCENLPLPAKSAGRMAPRQNSLRICRTGPKSATGCISGTTQPALPITRCLSPTGMSCSRICRLSSGTMLKVCLSRAAAQVAAARTSTNSAPI